MVVEFVGASWANVQNRMWVGDGWFIDVHSTHTHLALLSAAREGLEVLIVGAWLVDKLV